MTRRFFFGMLGSSAVHAVAAPAPRITRIRLSTVQGRFHKFVAMNSYDRAPKGYTYEHGLIRIETSEGVEGIGPAGAANPDYITNLRRLIGANPLGLYRMDGGRIVSRSEEYAPVLTRYKHLDGALFDLIGKFTNKPAWGLLGEPARDRVDVYDGTLYFSDVWFRDRGVQAVVEEAEESAKSGYSALKLKLGRGSKWMDRNAGMQRDIEVVNRVRQAVGTKPRILVDPNDGYTGDFDRLWQMIAETRSAGLYWLEEPFREDVNEYVRLKDKLQGAGIALRIADGENLREPEQFAPYLKPRRLMDVLQLDIRTGGFIANRDLALASAEVGAQVIPHNWASHLGMLMGLQIAKATPRIPAAEDDRSTYDVVTGEGYEFRAGSYSIPDRPGLSLRVNEQAYELKCKPGEINVA